MLIESEKCINMETTERSLSKWRMYAIVQLVCTFAVFLPLAIYFEFKVSASIMENYSDVVSAGQSVFLAPLFVKPAYAIAKYGPLVSIGLAGLISIYSLFQPNAGSTKGTTICSLIMCLVTAVFGTVSIFFPLFGFYFLIGVFILIMVLGAYTKIKGE